MSSAVASGRRDFHASIEETLMDSQFFIYIFLLFLVIIPLMMHRDCDKPVLKSILSRIELKEEKSEYPDRIPGGSSGAIRQLKLIEIRYGDIPNDSEKHLIFKSWIFYYAGGF